MPNFPQWIPPGKTPTEPVPKAAPSGTARMSGPKGVWGEEDRERIPPETLAKVWKKRFGFRSTGTCVCCLETTLRRDDFACGYRRAYASGGGHDVSNLEPICSRCKEKMGAHDLASWCRKFREELQVVKPMPKTTAKKPASRKTTAKKTVRKTAPKKSGAKTIMAKKPVRKTAKKPAAKKAKKK